MRETTLQLIREHKLITIVRGLPHEQLLPLAEALYAGGIRMMEITFAQNNPDSWKDTASGIKLLSEKMAGKICVGAGTVVSLEQLQMAYEAGAQYIISPSVHVDVIKKTRELGLVSLPGALTPTEAMVAYAAGADMVKIFPIGDLGASYLKSIVAPLSHIPFLAVGGVSDKNAGEFLAAGALGVGVGGYLVNKDLIAQGRFDEITAMAKKYVSAVQA